MKDEPRTHPFRDSNQDIAAAHRIPDTPQTRAPAYRLAFADPDFMTREELRPVRLQLELLKPQLVMDERGIESTIVLFGGARIPAPENKAAARTPMLADLTRYYDEARRFARMMTERSMESYGKQNVIVTGGGPGVMEAGNRGASEAGGQSIGLNIVLPHEQAPNQYVTPDLSFNFHYFAIRKMHFLMRAAAVCIFPGGFVQQHVLTGTRRHDGVAVRLPCAIICQLEEGRIKRLDEYFDSAHVATFRKYANS